MSPMTVIMGFLLPNTGLAFNHALTLFLAGKQELRLTFNRIDVFACISLYSPLARVG